MSPSTRVLIKRLLLGFIITVGSVTLLGIAVWIYPPLFLVVVAHGPRSPYCTLWQGVIESNVQVKQAKIATQLAGAARRVKTDGKLELWSTPAGDFWIPAGSEETLTILLAQQQRRIYGDERSGVRKGDIVLDCGAHVGVFTRTSLAAGAKVVVAIEPSPDSVECLRRNFAEEVVAGRVIVYPKGVWDKEEVLTLHANLAGGAGDSFVNQDARAKEIPGIPVTTIDKLTAELQLARIDFIKADIKGATERALLGGRGVITAYHPRLAISTEDPPEDPKRIAELVASVSPAYNLRCGPCILHGNEIRTDVMFFGVSGQ